MTFQNQEFNRRQFLKWVGILGISGFIAACRAQSISITPTIAEYIMPTDTALPSGNYPTTKPPAQNAPDDRETQTSNGPVTASPLNEIEPISQNAYLAVGRGTDIEAVVMTALVAIGGMEQFVKSGSDVIIKPNICCDYYPFEYAATTNPIVLATLVRLCLGAGAKKVRVMDQPFGGTAESAYKKSGIAEAVESAGGEMELMNWNKYVNTVIPEGRDIREWEFYKPILDADVLINVPIAKHHGLTKLTLGGKNLLGTISNRAGIHQNHGQRIADLVSCVRPSLTVIDAIRILMKNGPTGGNLNDVKKTDTIIASRDIVAADAYAATLFGLTGADIAYIQAGADMGLGTLDLSEIKIEEINL